VWVAAFIVFIDMTNKLSVFLTRHYVCHFLMFLSPVCIHCWMHARYIDILSGMVSKRLDVSSKFFSPSKTQSFQFIGTNHCYEIRRKVIR